MLVWCINCPFTYSIVLCATICKYTTQIHAQLVIGNHTETGTKYSLSLGNKVGYRLFCKTIQLGNRNILSKKNSKSHPEICEIPTDMYL